MRLGFLITKILLTTFLLLGSIAVHADGALLKVPTRPGVTTTLYWEATENATATVFLFPGGGGGFGRVEGGKPTSQNFLVRSVQHFLANGFNVAIFGRPTDSEGLDYADRISETHLTDVRMVMEAVKARNSSPIWVVGTSRGTVSATATAIAMQDSIAGLVLTSSVVNDKKPGAVPKQDLAAIRVPVLVFHHARDACPQCRPYEVPAILKGLKSAPVKKEIMVTGGENPAGDLCAAHHWHGFIGMEKQAVDMISDWIRKPAT